jgi:antitoxin component YwqK of YwqJK toxin-antitoxin module
MQVVNSSGEVLLSGQFDHGLPTGVWVGRYRSGNKRSKVVYSEGTLLQAEYWNEDGTRSENAK